MRADDEHLRRRRSARLSATAAGLTAVLGAWAVAANGDRSGTWLTWLATITLPVVVLSVAAAAQYSRGRSTAAGAAAAATYWVFLVVFWFAGGLFYLLGALLQSTAWWISRPRSHDPRARHARAGTEGPLTEGPAAASPTS